MLYLDGSTLGDGDGDRGIGIRQQLLDFGFYIGLVVSDVNRVRATNLETDFQAIDCRIVTNIGCIIQGAIVEGDSVRRIIRTWALEKIKAGIEISCGITGVQVRQIDCAELIILG